MNTRGSGFCRGSSANCLMMLTIFVMGTIIMFSVSPENIREPILMTIQVKIVFENWSFDSKIQYLRVLNLA